MQSITTVLILLLAVVGSGLVGRVLPLPLPLPLVQIAFGAVLAWTLDVGIQLDPEIFFLLFLPPLLFLDGWRIPKDDLFRDAGTILELALGLVVFTVLGLGFFIHWLIPAMPLAVAFALAAVLAPTDPIAVSAIASRVPIPKRLVHLLEGESLLNDASGLVCLRFAVAAALMGTFSLSQAVGTFLWLALAGLALGVAVAWGVARVKRWMVGRFGLDQGSSILITLLLPFGAYLLAEHVHASGILAAVGAGVTMSLTEDPLHAPASTRIRRGVVWDMVQFAANGAIFVILGEQLPGIFFRAAETVRQSSVGAPALLALYVAAITLVLAAARFGWVWMSFRLSRLIGRRQELAARRPSPRLIGATSLAGVKGAVTLAGILTLPLSLPDGTPFPARDLAIFLAAGVIILSLLAATVGLPALLKGLEFPPDGVEAEAEGARAAAGAAAIQAVESALRRMADGRDDAALYSQAAAQVMSLYRARRDTSVGDPDGAGTDRRLQTIERQLLRIGLQAEREAVVALLRERKIGDAAMHKVVREIDLSETRLAG